jgi:fatty acid desaturase
MTAAPASVLPKRPTTDYATLLAQVRSAGLLERSGRSSLPRIVGPGALVIVGVVGLVWLGSSWWQLGVAAYFAIVFAQLGFLGHDAGHQQLFATKKWNDRLGLVVSNLGIGLSYGWWVDKHNRHHRNPNDLERDPDVQRNVLAWSHEQAARQRGPLRFVAAHQGAFFFPLLVFEAWNLHVGSARTLLARPRERRVEIVLLAAHAIGCLMLLLLVVSPMQAIAFVAVQQSLLGIYLGCSFAPNHKGMPNPDDATAPDFLLRQVLTSRDVTGGRVITAALGGLNFQIEHHLFPSMPSRNLRRCQPLVKKFCTDRDIPYCEATLLDSYATALRYLRSVEPGRRGRRVEPSNRTAASSNEGLTIMSESTPSGRAEDEPRLDVHNNNIDERAAERGLCGTRDLTSGRTCHLTALHPDGCDFGAASDTPRH